MVNVYFQERNGDASLTDLRLIVTVGGQYLRASDGVLEAYNDPADYYVAASAVNALGRYTFAVPTPAVRPVTVDYQIRNIETDEVVGFGALEFDAAGNEVNRDARAAAILADTHELQIDLANGGRLDNLIDGIHAKTTNLPAIPAAVGSLMGLADGAITAAKLAADAITAAKVAADAVTKVQNGLATEANVTAVGNAVVSRASQTSVNAVKERTDRIPDAPAAVGSTMTCDLTQVLDESATGATFGAALNAARAQGFGDWELSEDRLSLILYRSDNETPLMVFALPAPKNPTSRHKA